MTGRNGRRGAVARAAPVVAAVAVLTGCGDGPMAPPPFPAVDGTFVIEVEFRDIPVQWANASGTITLQQSSRHTGELSGMADVTVVILSPAVHIQELVDPSVTGQGRITFELPPENPTSTWRFEGTIGADGTRFHGSHVLSGEAGNSIGGTWRAVRR